MRRRACQAEDAAVRSFGGRWDAERTECDKVPGSRLERTVGLDHADSLMKLNSTDFRLIVLRRESTGIYL